MINRYDVQHTNDRLDTRGLNYHMGDLLAIASNHRLQDTAVILGTIHERMDGATYRDNTDVVILIVRGGYPKTIMLRRAAQRITADSLRVDRLVILQ